MEITLVPSEGLSLREPRISFSSRRGGDDSRTVVALVTRDGVFSAYGSRASRVAGQRLAQFEGRTKEALYAFGPRSLRVARIRVRVMVPANPANLPLNQGVEWDQNEATTRRVREAWRAASTVEIFATEYAFGKADDDGEKLEVFAYAYPGGTRTWDLHVTQKISLEIDPARTRLVEEDGTPALSETAASLDEASLTHVCFSNELLNAQAGRLDALSRPLDPKLATEAVLRQKKLLQNNLLSRAAPAGVVNSVDFSSARGASVSLGILARYAEPSKPTLGIYGASRVFFLPCQVPCSEPGDGDQVRESGRVLTKGDRTENIAAPRSAAV